MWMPGSVRKEPATVPLRSCQESLQGDRIAALEKLLTAL